MTTRPTSSEPKISASDLGGRLRDCDLLVTDLDGTLVDTEPYHLQSYETILQAILGEPARVTYEEIIGKTGLQIWQELGSKYLASVHPAELNKLRKIVLQGLFASSPPKQEAAVLALVRQFQGPRLILTTQGQASATALVSDLGIDHLFDSVISVQSHSMGAKGKLAIIRSLATEQNIPLSRVAWIEDGAPEVAEAHAQGILVIIVKRAYNAINQSCADYLLP
jgi:phosphoglycolate phosphatase-like HAD superfamily hydrolase